MKLHGDQNSLLAPGKGKPSRAVLSSYWGKWSLYKNEKSGTRWVWLLWSHHVAAVALTENQSLALPGKSLRPLECSFTPSTAPLPLLFRACGSTKGEPDSHLQFHFSCCFWFPPFFSHSLSPSTDTTGLPRARGKQEPPGGCPSQHRSFSSPRGHPPTITADHQPHC